MIVLYTYLIVTTFVTIIVCALCACTDESIEVFFECDEWCEASWFPVLLGHLWLPIPAIIHWIYKLVNYIMERLHK